VRHKSNLFLSPSSYRHYWFCAYTLYRPWTVFVSRGPGIMVSPNVSAEWRLIEFSMATSLKYFARSELIFKTFTPSAFTNETYWNYIIGVIYLFLIAAHNIIITLCRFRQTVRIIIHGVYPLRFFAYTQ